MADQAALAEIEKRIQVVEDNIRQLVEQAAAYSGAADEERNADRIADQQAKLDALLKERRRTCSNRPSSLGRRAAKASGAVVSGRTDLIRRKTHGRAQRFAN